MPRTKPESTVEHRLSLSNYERVKVSEALEAYKKKSYIQGVSSVLGISMGGAGILLAGWAYMKFKAPDIPADIKEFVFEKMDSIADVVIPGTPIEMRREAQALAAERARIAKAMPVLCTLSSENYDAAACSTLQQEKANYVTELLAFQQRVRDMYGVGGTFGNRNRRNSFYWNLIFGGLGDIDPNQDSNPNNNEP